MFSEFIQIIIKSNTLNFVIVVVLICFLLAKLKIGNKLQNLADSIKSYVDTSENEKSDAERKLNIINNKVSKLGEVEERIKKSTQNSINNYENKVQIDIENQKSDISKTSERLLRLETKKFKNKLTDLISMQSVDVARENAIKNFQNNKELQNLYINKAIKELDGIKI